MFTHPVSYWLGQIGQNKSIDFIIFCHYDNWKIAPLVFPLTLLKSCTFSVRTARSIEIMQAEEYSACIPSIVGPLKEVKYNEGL